MTSIILLILQYKYVILFPLAVIEGPILAVIAGFIVSMDLLNAPLVYVIILLADVVGDNIYYFIGRFGWGFVDRHGHRIKITPAKIEKTKEYFHSNKKKALFFSKIFHGIGFTGLIVAGGLKIPYPKFFIICFIASIIQTFVLLMIGILFGSAYDTIGQYLNYYAAGSIVVVLCAIGYVFVSKLNLIENKKQ